MLTSFIQKHFKKLLRIFSQLSKMIHKVSEDLSWYEIAKCLEDIHDINWIMPKAWETRHLSGTIFHISGVTSTWRINQKSLEKCFDRPWERILYNFIGASDILILTFFWQKLTFASFAQLFFAIKNVAVLFWLILFLENLV